jgi:AraC family transcriptional regulator, positive regulator of tynA and feaB
MIEPRGDFNSTPALDYEGWRDLLRSLCGRYNPEGVEPRDFVGWVRPVSVFGFTALDFGSNAVRMERTYQDVRLDGMDQYIAIIQVTGESVMNHNEQTVRLAAGDVALVDAAQPMTAFTHNRGRPWNIVSLNLRRESLVTHLGFDLQGGLCRRGGTPASRLLLDLIRNAAARDESALSAADSYMQLVVYDLVGALFAPSDPRPGSGHAEELFMRIRGLINDRLIDPDFGPAEVAAETGISLRYVHKLFTARHTTCGEFIYSRRLEHAARLLQRRALLGTRQPLSEIAYACGFRDYTHFARRFRRRFGHVPGAHSA